MWNTEMVIILRHMIDDLGDPPKYSDDRLIQLILVGAQFTQQENRFDTAYVIDLENSSLTPDPTLEVRDDAFINLTLLRSACLLAGSGLGKTANAGLLVSEGPYRFDNRGSTTAKTLQVKTWCQAYTDAKWELVTNGSVPGEAIIGPYRVCEGKNYAGPDYYNTRIYRTT